MFSASGHEGLLLLVPLVLWLVAIVVLYWIIRLAVRHGVLDARRRSAGGSPGPAGGAPPPPEDL